MPIRVHFGTQAIYGFLLTLTRVGGALTLLPLPGFQNTPQSARIILIIGIAFCLFPLWPVTVPMSGDAGALALAAVSETAAGLLIGLSVAFIFEAFQLGAQAISFQTGFGFASTFDPSSQADSGVFQVFTQLACGLMFFGFGIHSELVRMLAKSMVLFHLEGDAFKGHSVMFILQQGTSMFITSLKLALPVVALLFVVDQALAGISRLQAQLQLLNLAFPAKIALSIFFFAALLTRWPSLYDRWAHEVLGKLIQLFAQ
jgi:flagellar biosynthesis protein FliR